MKKIDEYVQLIQAEIHYCATCQPYDDGDVVWVLGEQRELEELFDEYRVPEKFRDVVASKIFCPNCGYQFQRWDDYGTETPEEKRNRELIEEWADRHNDQLDEFAVFLEKYPYLGALHELGGKIVELMPQFTSVSIHDQEWFRARGVKDGRVLKSEDMLPPNPEVIPVPEGRYNHFGQSHWYLARTEFGAASEVVPDPDNEYLVWTQKIFIRKADNILDLRVGLIYPQYLDAPVLIAGLTHYSNILTKPTDHGRGWKPEYFVPRYIADVAKHYGYNGIIFTSSRHYSDNLVIFDIEKIDYEYIDEPRTIKAPRPKEINPFDDWIEIP